MCLRLMPGVTRIWRLVIDLFVDMAHVLKISGWNAKILGEQYEVEEITGLCRTPRATVLAANQCNQCDQSYRGPRSKVSGI